MVTVYIYLVKDSHGNTDSDLCSCPSNTIQICGMKDKEGNPLYFESDAYHTQKWCDDNGLELKKVEREETFDSLWNNE